jgi:arginyl-tRNA synthetase
MASIIDDLSRSIQEVLPDADRGGCDPTLLRVSPATNPAFGDYQFNGAMPLAKEMKKPPREIAAALVEKIRGLPFLEKVEVAGPGFVNLWIARPWLACRLERMCGDDRAGCDRPGEGRTVVLDYSSPNVAKPMHIGHIRSTFLGNALDRMHRFLGFQVVADNHIGDWGTQFGLLLSGFRSLGSWKAMEEDPMEELERVYVEQSQRAREDPALRDQAKQELVRLQQGEEENRVLWKQFVDASLKSLDKTYRRVGVSFDHTLGESFYNARLPGLVEDLTARGLARKSDGADVVFLEEEGLPPFIIRKSDGGFNYATTDIATLLYRQERWHPAKIVYVTDERQQLHFRQLFAVARRLGAPVELEHVWFGVMRLPEGTFSTRDGNVIRLEKLLDEAERKAYEVARRLNPGLDEETQRAIARQVGLGAVKYADLSQNRQSTILFTWEKALSLEGNSAPYLQYTYARIQSVFRKYVEECGGQGVPEGVPIELEEELEFHLAKRILEFPEFLGKAVAAYRPNLMTDYLFDLAQLYNRFYQNVPFLKAREGTRESRLVLCAQVAKIIRTGLGLLGIEVPDRM